MKTTIKIISGVIGVIFMLFSLLGCVDSSSKKDNELLDRTATQIIESIEAHDINMFRMLLSSDIASESDVDDGFMYMCDLLDEAVVEISEIGNGSSELISKEGSGKTLLGGYDVITETDVYELDFELITLNEDNRGARGIVFIKLFDKALLNQGVQRRSSNMYDRLGVYNPSWDD